ncbi:MAG TPA: GNAT family protein [Phycisphaerales bacterium]|nr:GNAT family protein [Phycisphaerales bacterium]
MPGQETAAAATSLVEVKPAPRPPAAAGALAPAPPAAPPVSAATGVPAVEVLAHDELRTGRLVIRAVRASDRDAVCAMLDAARASVAPVLNIYQPGEDAVATFQRLAKAGHDGDASGRAWRRLVTLTTGEPVGMVHLLGIERGLTPKGDAGWWTAPRHRGCGYALEAVRAVVQHALAEPPRGLGLFMIDAAITPCNAASAKVAAGAGFVFTGENCSVQLAGGWASHEIWRAGAN